VISLWRNIDNTVAGCQAERGDCLTYLANMATELFCRTGSLFDQHRVLLSDTVHLVDGAVDLLDTTGLFDRGGRNFTHDVGYSRDGSTNLFHGGTGTLDVLGSFGHLLDGILDKVLDLFVRMGAALGQCTHFGSHHREALALLTGTCGLDRRIQGQNIGLERYAVDDADNIRNFSRACRYALHGGNDLANSGAAALGNLRCRDCQLVGLAGVVGVLLDSAGQLFHAGGGLLQGGCLLFGSTAQVGMARNNTLRAVADQVKTRPHIADTARQTVLYTLQQLSKAAEFFGARVDPVGQVAACKRVQLSSDYFHGAQCISRNHAQRHECQNDSQHADHGKDPHSLIQTLIGRI